MIDLALNQSDLSKLLPLFYCFWTSQFCQWELQQVNFPKTVSFLLFAMKYTVWFDFYFLEFYADVNTKQSNVLPWRASCLATLRCVTQQFLRWNVKSWEKCQQPGWFCSQESTQTRWVSLQRSFTVQWTLHNGIALGQTISDPINQIMPIISKLASTYVRHDRMIWDL
jgi:hypothetical protein